MVRRTTAPVVAAQAVAHIDSSSQECLKAICTEAGEDTALESVVSILWEKPDLEKFPMENGLVSELVCIWIIKLCVVLKSKSMPY